MHNGPSFDPPRAIAHDRTIQQVPAAGQPPRQGELRPLAMIPKRLPVQRRV